MESTAPTTGPRAAAHGIADFRQKLVSSDYNLENPIEYTWKPRSDAKPEEVVYIYPLDSSNYRTWIDLSLKNPHGFETKYLNDGKDEMRRTLADNMVDYALKLHRIQLHDAEIDRQYQAAQTAYNIGEQGERNRITFMNHDQLIQDLAAKGFNTQSSAISSANDGQLRKMLWDQLGPLKRGGRRRKTKKSKRRTRSTRSARKTRRARK